MEQVGKGRATRRLKGFNDDFLAHFPAAASQLA
jgi:hypothetical protein